MFQIVGHEGAAGPLALFLGPYLLVVCPGILIDGIAHNQMCIAREDMDAKWTKRERDSLKYPNCSWTIIWAKQNQIFSFQRRFISIGRFEDHHSKLLKAVQNREINADIH